MLPALGVDHTEMEVHVTVGVQSPDAVDCEALKAGLPRGKVRVKAVIGGLDIKNPDNGEVSVVATAAVEAFLDPKRMQDRVG